MATGFNLRRENAAPPNLTGTYVVGLVGLFCCSAALFTMGSCADAEAETYYVPDHFASIQAAIIGAADGDEILVRQGTYVEALNFLGRPITVRSTDPENQAVVEATVVDANFAGSVLVFIHQERSSSVLSGLKLINGNSSYGGGILCQGESSPRITYCMIEGNTARHAGGGIYIDQSNPIIQDCLIADNNANGDEWSMGGGIACVGSAPLLARVQVRANHANRRGGGLHCIRSSPTIADCLIEENAACAGGGIRINANSYPLIRNCTFRFNVGDCGLLGGDGGGVKVYKDCCPEFIACRIVGNISPKGGAASIEQASAVFRNCILSGNSARFGGGALQLHGTSDVEATNCTIIENTPQAEANAAIQLHQSSAQGGIVLKNCVLWEDGEKVISGGGRVEVSYSDVHLPGGRLWPGIGNINADPVFVEALGYEYILNVGSPCIDAGTGDADGIDWEIFGRKYSEANSIDPDMGAYGGPDAVGLLN